MAATPVTVDSFVRAETRRMFAAFHADAGGVNRLKHNRAPTPIEHQPVIRMNRDTLYSAGVVDISAGATVSIPDGGDRYVSVMVVNEDHYINRVLHEPGEHRLTMDEFDTPWVAVAARILVDPADEDDLAAVNALLELARHVGGFARAFGARGDVDPIRHLIGTAAGWGGLPDEEATYLSVEPRLPVGEFALVVREVPVDGFWSISVYNADGFFEPNERNAYSVNNLTAVPDPDGSVTVHFGGCGDDRPNCLPIVDGWNYTVRLYRPRREVLDGSWAFPAVGPA